jgi:hypothetical protein
LQHSVCSTAFTNCVMALRQHPLLSLEHMCLTSVQASTSTAAPFPLSVNCMHEYGAKSHLNTRSLRGSIPFLGGLKTHQHLCSCSSESSPDYCPRFGCTQPLDSTVHSALSHVEQESSCSAYVSIPFPYPAPDDQLQPAGYTSRRTAMQRPLLVTL